MSTPGIGYPHRRVDGESLNAPVDSPDKGAGCGSASMSGDIQERWSPQLYVNGWLTRQVDTTDRVRRRYIRKSH